MQDERTIIEKIWTLPIFRTSVYFRVRRISYWFKFGIIAFPVVFSIGNWGIGSNWFWDFRENAGAR